MEPFDTFEHFGVKVELHYDTDAGDPYENFDQASRLLWLTGEGRRGDVPRDAETINGDYREPGTILRWLTLFGDEAVAIPFYCHDHGSSGYAVGLDCDAEGASGFVVVSRGKVAEEWPDGGTIDGEELTPVEMAERCARAEFAQWRAWAEGNVAGYVVAPGTPEEDSRQGYYGEEEYVRQEAKAAAEYAAFQQTKRVALTRTYALDPSPPAVPAEFEAWKSSLACRCGHWREEHAGDGCDAPGCACETFVADPRHIADCGVPA